MDKRKGRKTLRQRAAIAESEYVSYSLDNAVKIFLSVKRANNLKERTLRDYVIKILDKACQERLKQWRAKPISGKTYVDPGLEGEVNAF